MFDILQTTYEFRAERPLQLNMDMPAVTLRGAFGFALAEFLAGETSLPFAQDRLAVFRNLFAPEFESAPSGHHRTPARPFVVRGGFADDSERVLVMEVLLFGCAADLGPLTDRVVAVMAERGLGDVPGRGEPCEVRTLSCERVRPELPPAEWIEVDFITPVRIKARKQWCYQDIPFPALIARLAERYAQIVCCYGRDDGRDWAGWCRDLVDQACDVAGRRIAGETVQGRRVSSRTGDRCRIDGFVGRMQYLGDLRPFAELLAYLPYIHVGKGATFGCGWTVLTCYSR